MSRILTLCASLFVTSIISTVDFNHGAIAKEADSKQYNCSNNVRKITNSHGVTLFAMQKCGKEEIENVVNSNKTNGIVIVYNGGDLTAEARVTGSASSYNDRKLYPSILAVIYGPKEESRVGRFNMHYQHISFIDCAVASNFEDMEKWMFWTGPSIYTKNELSRLRISMNLSMENYNDTNEIISNCNKVGWSYSTCNKQNEYEELKKWKLKYEDYNSQYQNILGIDKKYAKYNCERTEETPWVE